MQYPFGHGLSYTTFSMSSLSINPTSDGAVSALPADNPIVPSGNPALWDQLYTISATVTNTGSVPGSAVSQLYLALPQAENADPSPKKVLRGFSKDVLQPGQSCEVSFDLTRRDISYWNVGVQQWRIAEGEVGVMAGFSSRDIQAMGSFNPLRGDGMRK